MRTHVVMLVLLALLAGRSAQARLDPLQFHAAKGNVNKVVELLALSETDVNARDDDDQRTALHAVVDLSTLNVPAIAGKDALQSAHKGRMDLTRLLLQHKADPNIRDAQGHTAIHLAAAEPRALDLLLVILSDAQVALDLSISDNKGRTALFDAVSNNNVPAAMALLKANKGTASLRDANGDAPLHMAVELGSTEMVTALLEAGAHADVRDTSLETPLHRCVRNNNTELCALLMAKGAHKDAQNKNLQSPLHLAVELKTSVPLIELLVTNARPSDITITDARGRSPFFLAALSGNIGALKTLTVEHDLLVADEHGWTPFHAAASTGHVDVLQHLLDVYYKTYSSNSLNLLRSRPMDIADDTGNKPLHLALYNGHSRAARFLVYSGASIDEKAKFLQATLGEEERQQTSALLASATSTLTRLVNWLPALAIISLLVYGAILYFMFIFARLAASTQRPPVTPLTNGVSPEQ